MHFRHSSHGSLSGSLSSKSNNAAPPPPVAKPLSPKNGVPPPSPLGARSASEASSALSKHTFESGSLASGSLVTHDPSVSSSSSSSSSCSSSVTPEPSLSSQSQDSPHTHLQQTSKPRGVSVSSNSSRKRTSTILSHRRVTEIPMLLQNFTTGAWDREVFYGLENHPIEREVITQRLPPCNPPLTPLMSLYDLLISLQSNLPLSGPLTTIHNENITLPNDGNLRYTVRRLELLLDLFLKMVTEVDGLSCCCDLQVIHASSPTTERKSEIYFTPSRTFGLTTNLTNNPLLQEDAANKRGPYDCLLLFAHTFLSLDGPDHIVSLLRSLHNHTDTELKDYVNDLREAALEWGLKIIWAIDQIRASLPVCQGALPMNVFSCSREMWWQQQALFKTISLLDSLPLCVFETLFEALSGRMQTSRDRVSGYHPLSRIVRFRNTDALFVISSVWQRSSFEQLESSLQYLIHCLGRVENLLVILSDPLWYRYFIPMLLTGGAQVPVNLRYRISNQTEAQIKVDLVIRLVVSICIIILHASFMGIISHEDNPKAVATPPQDMQRMSRSRDRKSSLSTIFSGGTEKIWDKFPDDSLEPPPPVEPEMYSAILLSFFDSIEAVALWTPDTVVLQRIILEALLTKLSHDAQTFRQDCTAQIWENLFQLCFVLENFIFYSPVSDRNLIRPMAERHFTYPGIHAGDDVPLVTSLCEFLQGLRVETLTAEVYDSVLNKKKCNYVKKRTLEEMLFWQQAKAYLSLVNTMEQKALKKSKAYKVCENALRQRRNGYRQMRKEMLGAVKDRKRPQAVRAAPPIPKLEVQKTFHESDLLETTVQKFDSRAAEQSYWKLNKDSLFKAKMNRKKREDSRSRSQKSRSLTLSGTSRDEVVEASTPQGWWAGRKLRRMSPQSILSEQKLRQYSELKRKQSDSLEENKEALELENEIIGLRDFLVEGKSNERISFRDFLKESKQISLNVLTDFDDELCAKPDSEDEEDPLLWLETAHNSSSSSSNSSSSSSSSSSSGGGGSSSCNGSRSHGGSLLEQGGIKDMEEDEEEDEEEEQPLPPPRESPSFSTPTSAFPSPSSSFPSPTTSIAAPDVISPSTIVAVNTTAVDLSSSSLLHCAWCGSGPSDEGFHDVDKQPFCKDCCRLQLVCAGCGGRFAENNMFTRATIPSLFEGDQPITLLYHASCFVCAEDKQPFDIVRDGTYPNIRGNAKQLYCLPHFSAKFGNKCAYCNEVIEKVTVWCLERPWHPEHLLCSNNCGARLNEHKLNIPTAKEWARMEVRGHVLTRESYRTRVGFCEPCYEKDVVDECKGCRAPFQLGEEACLAVDGARVWCYHLQCYQCVGCVEQSRENMNGNGLTLHQDLLLCSIHLQAANQGVMPDYCSRCLRVIHKGQTVKVHQSYYHASCVICSTCKVQLDCDRFAGPNPPPLMLCPTHLEKQMQGSSCEVCFEPIMKGTAYTLNGGRYHDACMVCNECKVRLGGVENTQVCVSPPYAAEHLRNLFWCSSHFMKHFNPFCNVCKKRIMGTAMMMGGLAHHRECLRCSVCTVELKPHEIAECLGVIYCQEHILPALIKAASLGQNVFRSNSNSGISSNSANTNPNNGIAPSLPLPQRVVIHGRGLPEENSLSPFRRPTFSGGEHSPQTSSPVSEGVISPPRCVSPSASTTFHDVAPSSLPTSTVAAASSVSSSLLPTLLPSAAPSFLLPASAAASSLISSTRTPSTFLGSSAPPSPASTQSAFSFAGSARSRSSSEHPSNSPSLHGYSQPSSANSSPTHAIGLSSILPFDPPSPSRPTISSPTVPPPTPRPPTKSPPARPPIQYVPFPTRVVLDNPKNLAISLPHEISSITSEPSHVSSLVPVQAPSFFATSSPRTSSVGIAKMMSIPASIQTAQTVVVPMIGSVLATSSDLGSVSSPGQPLSIDTNSEPGKQMSSPSPRPSRPAPQRPRPTGSSELSSPSLPVLSTSSTSSTSSTLSSPSSTSSHAVSVPRSIVSESPFLKGNSVLHSDRPPNPFATLRPVPRAAPPPVPVAGTLPRVQLKPTSIVLSLDTSKSAFVKNGANGISQKGSVSPSKPPLTPSRITAPIVAALEALEAPNKPGNIRSSPPGHVKRLVAAQGGAATTPALSPAMRPTTPSRFASAPLSQASSWPPPPSPARPSSALTPPVLQKRPNKPPPRLPPPATY